MNHFYKCTESVLILRAIFFEKAATPAIHCFSLALLLLCSVSTYAQQSAILQQRISIKTDVITLKQAFNKIGRSANCKFSYSDDLIGAKKNIQLNYSGTPLYTIIQDLLHDTPYKLLIQGNTIYIRVKPAANKEYSLTTDSLKTVMLDPAIVVTGQYKPQTLNESIYRVEVIDKIQIQGMAVSNVAELLKQELNIEIENEPGMGRSKVRVLGLNSQYVKILMDNIPVAGDENMGSDVDLTTISLDDVERVEIVKGAMGVEYGANSIAGVINIITKKAATNKTDVKLEIQEESVRDEYNWMTGNRAKGRHIQRFNISHNLKNGLSIGGSVSLDQFNGYWGEYEGAGLIKEPIDPYYPPRRGYEWSPKTSWNSSMFLSYAGSRMSVFYKFNSFTSALTNYSPNALPFFLKDEQLFVNASVNNDYKNHRYNHHLNIRGEFWENASYSIDASFQKNGLEHRRQAINLHDNSVLDKANGIPGSERLQATDWQKHYQSKGFYSKGTFLKPLFSNKIDLNLGYELDNTTGNQGYTNWFSDVSLNNPVEQTLFTGSAFVSFEWNASPKIMIRPGFRVNYNNKLSMRTNQSITTRYKLNERNDLRFIIGTSTRFPNYEELYTWFVNGIHDFRGNPDLDPEYGKSVELQWSYRKAVSKNIRLETNLSSMFQHITDRIVPITYRVPEEPSLTGRNTFTNENKYNGLLNQLDVKLVSDKFHLSFGGSVLGYRGDDDASIQDYRKFLLNTQANAQLTYVLPFEFKASLFYRFVGKQPLYVFVPKSYEDYEPNDFYKILSETDPYHNMDFNIAKTFFSKKIDLRIGVKNLFDVTDISYRPINKPDKVHLNNLRILRLYYGRSYFIRISYNINI